MGNVIAVVPCAGYGKRVGTKTNKQFLKLKGVPVAIHTLRKLAGNPVISELYPVIRPDEISLFENRILKDFPCPKIKAVIPGGAERQDSVMNALERVEGNPEIVVIHDGVRPFFTNESLSSCIQSAKEHGGAAVGLGAVDTIKTGENGFYSKTLDRRNIYMIQTPQAFRFIELVRAYKKVREQKHMVTDDAQAFELYGGRIRIVPGNRFNFKITTRQDLVLARKVVSYVED